MKRLFFAIICLAFFFSACAPAKKLTFMPCGTPEEFAYWQTVASNFTKQYDIDVELIPSYGDSDQQKESLLIPLRARMRDPDVVMLDSRWVGNGISDDSIESLDDYDFSTAPFFKHVIKAVNTNGMRYIPLDIETGALYYRKDLLTFYGYDSPPSTWRELVKISSRVQSKRHTGSTNFWGFLWQNSDDDAFLSTTLEFFSSSGGEVLNTNGIPLILTSNNMKVLQFMAALVQSNKVSPGSAYKTGLDDMRAQFMNGQALFVRDTTAMSAYYIPEGGSDNMTVGISPLPATAGRQSCAAMEGRFAAMSAYSDMKNEALLLIAYISSYAVQREFALRFGWKPGRRDVYYDPKVLRKYPYYRQISAIYGAKMIRPSIGTHPYIPGVIRKSFEPVIDGKTPPWEALNAVQLRFLEFYR